MKGIGPRLIPQDEMPKLKSLSNTNLNDYASEKINLVV